MPVFRQKGFSGGDGGRPLDVLGIGVEGPGHLLTERGWGTHCDDAAFVAHRPNSESVTGGCGRPCAFGGRSDNQMCPCSCARIILAVSRALRANVITALPLVGAPASEAVAGAALVVSRTRTS